MEELQIPGPALEDDHSIEMARVSNVREVKAWGIMSADVARHVSRALESGCEMDREAVIKGIHESFDAELNKPTSKLNGGFTDTH